MKQFVADKEGADYSDTFNPHIAGTKEYERFKRWYQMHLGDYNRRKLTRLEQESAAEAVVRISASEAAAQDQMIYASKRQEASYKAYIEVWKKAAAKYGMSSEFIAFKREAQYRLNVMFAIANAAYYDSLRDKLEQFQDAESLEEIFRRYEERKRQEPCSPDRLT
jgi:hypothetical protein